LDDDAEWGDRRRLVVGKGEGGVRSQESGVRRGGEEDVGARGGEEVPISPFNTQDSTRAPRPLTPDTPIVEASRVQVNPTGEIWLVADTADPVVQNSLNQFLTCEVRGKTDR
jgi:hypothetical protein